MADPENPDQREHRTSPAGRVRHDKSGRAIWEWAVDTGRHALDSTSRLLKRLDNPGLTLEEDEKKKAQDTGAGVSDKKAPPTFGGPREADPRAGKTRGFNPYDSRSPPPRRTPPTSGQAARPAVNQQKTPAKKPGLLSRLFGGKR
jgi:hypothetical protein